MPTNTLSRSTSPYLLQHRTNPVDWLPWGDEAWELARREDQLVIVSVGYSACHWCHVMEHETFEDEEAAAFMNAHFVSIKVDREERPDVDRVYMDAVQLMTKRGGWPLNCVALPDGRPIWGGTYFPRERWLAGLNAVLEVWRDEPDKVMAYAEQLAEAVAAMDDAGLELEALTTTDTSTDDLANRVDDQLRSGLERWRRTWDSVYGGTQGAPKFPLPCQVDFLLRYDGQTTEHALRTLRAMERGGIHDHVGGGFSRYSVDERWHVPHFEKMLYDNAQLLGSFAEAWARTPHPALECAAEGIVAFLNRELDHSSGGFASALDADSDGAEGTYYVWREEDLAKALNNEAQREEVRMLFDVGGRSHWEKGANVLMRDKRTDQEYWEDEKQQECIKEALQQMSTWRDGATSGRSKPGLDDKVLTAWTALTIGGLARAGKLMGRNQWVSRAERGAVFLRNVARVPGEPERLRRTWHSKGGPEVEGFAEDYALAIEAFLELHQATGDGKWRDEARGLMATALDRFYDDVSETFWFTARGAETLFARKQSTDDSVIPSANATFAACLWRLGWAYEIPAWRELSRRLTSKHLLGIPHLERSCKWASTWLDIRGPYAAVVIAAPCRAEGEAALETWWSAVRPGTWVDLVTPDTANIPAWMEGKRATSADPVQWYVCVDGACGLPCASAEEAWAQFKSLHT